MARTDLIADTLTMIRNAGYAKKDRVDVPSSKVTESIIAILKREGYIDNFKVVGEKMPFIRVYLKPYQKDKPFISNLKRASRPGLRIYRGKDELPRVLGGIGLTIISTSGGIMTGKEAKETGIGGEVVCYVW